MALNHGGETLAIRTHAPSSEEECTLQIPGYIRDIEGSWNQKTVSTFWPTCGHRAAVNS